MKVFYDLDWKFYGSEQQLYNKYFEEKHECELEGEDYCYESFEEMEEDMIAQGFIEECEIVTDMTDICSVYYYSEEDMILTINELYEMWLCSDEFYNPRYSFGQWLKWSDGLYGIRRTS